MNSDPRTIELSIFNPRILAGASINESTIDERSFTIGLQVGED